MPSWASVVASAVIIGALVGGAQNNASPPSDTAAAGSERPGTKQASESADPSPSPADTATSVRSTLPQLDRRGVRIALTFEDGPDPRWTPRVLDVLARHGATATFCLVGDQISGREAIVERIHAEGHVLCNHSVTHDYALPTRDPTRIRAEITGVTEQLRAVVPDASVTAFRAPGGRFSTEVAAAADAAGLDSWAWSIDSRDWRSDDADAIVARVLDSVAPGAVVLMHDGDGNRAATVAALQEIIPVLTSVGYEFVGLPDVP